MTASTMSTWVSQSFLPVFASSAVRNCDCQSWCIATRRSDEARTSKFRDSTKHTRPLPTVTVELRISPAARFHSTSPETTSRANSRSLHTLGAALWSYQPPPPQKSV